MTDAMSQKAPNMIKEIIVITDKGYVNRYSLRDGVNGIIADDGAVLDDLGSISNIAVVTSRNVRTYSLKQAAAIDTPRSKDLVFAAANFRDLGPGECEWRLLDDNGTLRKCYVCSIQTGGGFRDECIFCEDGQPCPSYG